MALNECREEEEIKGPQRGPERFMVTPTLTLLSCKHLGLDHTLASENNGNVVLHSSGGRGEASWSVTWGNSGAGRAALLCQFPWPRRPSGGRCIILPAVKISNSPGPCPEQLLLWLPNLSCPQLWRQGKDVAPVGWGEGRTNKWGTGDRGSSNTAPPIPKWQACHCYISVETYRECKTDRSCG